tara:strand:+ start:250 stop:435 length:186 start_codon:yes stop_codon:yes gene_type:complete
MATVKEMAQAHLVTVQRTIQDLQQQKINIDQEIEKLTQYLNESAGELEKETNASGVEVDVK